MSSIRLRLRGPEGVSTLSLPSTSTWGDLLTEISLKTNFYSFDLKSGYPPKPLSTADLPSSTPLSALPFKLNGEQLIVSPLESSATSASASTSAARPAQPRQPPSRVPQTSSSQPSSSQEQPPLSLARLPNPSLDLDPPSVPLPLLSSTLVLRVMPDDNSCLFRAISSAVLGSSLDGMTELRSIVAETILSSPEIYSEAVLEKPPESYCAWIKREDSWGGGIELSILSQYFEVEICSVDVKTLRVDRFNEGRGEGGRGKRCVLVYSGIHYDVCAAAPERTLGIGEGGEEDRKIFEVVRGGDGEEFDGGVLEAAVELCRVLRKRNYFTDTNDFGLRCNTCGQRGNGQMWAVEHARVTGHGDFGEGN